MNNYAVVSIETHLFFSRIMKEHALFLEAAFQGKDVSWIKRAASFRREFEHLLGHVTGMADEIVGKAFIASHEMVTQFTLPAEKRTSNLTGIPIDSTITRAQQDLRPGFLYSRADGIENKIDRVNERALVLVEGLIDFKQNILKNVRSCQLYTANYPLLIEHIMREAKLYRSILIDLQKNGEISRENMQTKEIFWNQIMMEHAMFIRGLLDPTENELIIIANEFAQDYEKLLEMAKQQDYRAINMLSQKSLEETLKYREFKTVGADGILECKIESLILPLLADHVLREANHYIRVLETGMEG